MVVVLVVVVDLVVVESSKRAFPASLVSRTERGSLEGAIIDRHAVFAG